MQLKIKILSLIFIFAAIICGCSPDESTHANSNNAEKIQANINAVREDSGAPPKNFDDEEKVEVAENSTPNIETPNTEIAEVQNVAVDDIEQILNSMKLEEKIGQMMIFGFHGITMNDDINWMFNQCHMGGVILFDRNMENKAQVKALTESLQAGRKIPLFIALDEEGGIVSRMANDLTPPPSQQEIEKSGDSSLAYSSANSISQELKNIGINLNFAPVADVGTPDTRSFSDDANIVAEFVSQAAKGYEDAGIFYTLKHFPGIGLWNVDSHQDIETIVADRYTFDTVDLVPFKKIINERDNSKFMIMVSHYKYTAFDAENSATLSPAVMTELLRNELGFKGVIITDDLDMGAVSKYHDERYLSVASVKAGADIVLSCHEYEKQRKMYEGVLEAVKRGEISEERINESVRRILKMKQAGRILSAGNNSAI